MSEPWKLEFSPEAEEKLKELDGIIRKRVVEKLSWFLENFDSIVPLPLHADFKNFYKLRLGDWRIMYRIQWNSRVIRVEDIDKRDKIYKDK